jgi:hypothetical protein
MNVVQKDDNGVMEQDIRQYNVYVCAEYRLRCRVL